MSGRCHFGLLFFSFPEIEVFLIFVRWLDVVTQTNCWYSDGY